MRHNQIKSEVISMSEIGKISCELLHDFVNPITGITLYLENLNQKEIKDLLIPVNETSKNIRDFINIIKEATSNPDQIEILNIRKIIDKIICLLRHKAIRNNIKLISFQETANVLILANKLKMYRIIINLISNAIEAFDNIPEKENKTVSIRVYEKRGNIIIGVSDNATGIESSILEKMFKKNFSTKSNGFGIGLISVKNIIEQDLAGKITVHSQINKGTDFMIEISSKYRVNFQ